MPAEEKERTMVHMASRIWGQIGLNFLRIMAGFLIAPHGAQKLFGVLGAEAVEFPSLLTLAAALELFGGLAIFFGFYTRTAAFLLAGELATAYWMVHGPRAFLPIVNRGELAVLFCFAFFFLFTNGGGNFSIDGWLRWRGKGRMSWRERDVVA